MVGPRFIVNDTTRYIPMESMEVLLQAWERSPFPPDRPILTEEGLEHARQQLLKEHLLRKWRGTVTERMAARWDERALRAVEREVIDKYLGRRVE